MSSKRGLLSDIKLIKEFLIKLEISESQLKSDFYEEYLDVLRSVGNIEGILSFQKVMLDSMKREVESLSLDISGDGKQIKLSDYNEEKIYD